MRAKAVFALLAMAVSMNAAHACSRAFAIDLDFSPNSATLEKSEVVKLVAWLDKWRQAFPRLEGAKVDGIAPPAAPNARLLAKQRAAAAAQALQQLLEGVPVHASSHISSPSSSFKGGNYAAIDLVPFQADLADCNPVPVQTPTAEHEAPS